MLKGELALELKDNAVPVLEALSLCVPHPFIASILLSNGVGEVFSSYSLVFASKLKVGSTEYVGRDAFNRLASSDYRVLKVFKFNSPNCLFKEWIKVISPEIKGDLIDLQILVNDLPSILPVYIRIKSRLFDSGFFIIDSETALSIHPEVRIEFSFEKETRLELEDLYQSFELAIIGEAEATGKPKLKIHSIPKDAIIELYSVDPSFAQLLIVPPVQLLR